MNSGSIVRGGANPASLGLGQRLMFELPWHAAASLLRLLYGFRVEGKENLPTEGPFILVNNEHSPVAFLITGWIAIVALKEAFRRNPETIAFLREELFEFPFFRSALNEKTPGRYAALTPVAAGRLALGLLEAYRTLQNGGIVVLNPEGDMPWDGRPLPLGHALAWLGLHTAAPIVPAMITMGAYDIWPRWQPRMNLTGRVRLRIGRPFRLSETPLDHIREEDLAPAEKIMRARFDELRYEQGGLAEWSGAPTKNGIPLDKPVQIQVLAARPPDGINSRRTALWRRGIALLLWRCPICHAEDSIQHERPLVGEQTLFCYSCHSRWVVRHIAGHDFRLEVREGPQELVGLDMALSAWYDEMKRDLMEGAAQPHDDGSNAEESVIAETNGASLLPRSPNALLDRWDGREPPSVQPRYGAQLSGWGRVGKGKLVLTDERLIWHGPIGDLDFWWRNVSSVSLWMLNTLTIRYGAAPYRFELGQENGLKWLTLSILQAQRVAAKTGRKLTISPF